MHTVTVINSRPGVCISTFSVFGARAAEELAEETQSKGLWAKAFSDANGDEKTQRALYIKYRAEQLIKNIVE